MCEKKLMIFDSRDRFNLDESSTDYLVFLKKGKMKVEKMELKSVFIPWTIYNISSAKNNNKMSILENEDEKITIILQDGFYDISSLCDIITDKFGDNDSLSAGSYSIDFDNNTMKVTISADTNFIIYGSNSDEDSTGLEQLLGFTTETSSDETHVAPNVPSIFSANYLLLNIDVVNNNIDTLEAHKGSTFVISTEISGSDNPVGGITSMTEKSTWIQECKNPNYLQQFRISLRDHNNEIVDLNGADWYFVIEFYLCN